MSKRILGLANSMVTSCLYPFTSLRGIFYPNGVKGKSSHSSCLSSLGKGRCRFSASLSLSHVFCLPKDAQTRMNFGGSCWGREGSWLSLQAQGRRAWSDKGTVIRGGRRKSFSLVTPWLRSAQKKKFRVFLNWITSISQNPRNKTKQISLEWELQTRISCLPADPSPQSLQAGVCAQRTFPDSPPSKNKSSSPYLCANDKYLQGHAWNESCMGRAAGCGSFIAPARLRGTGARRALTQLSSS